MMADYNPEPNSPTVCNRSLAIRSGFDKIMSNAQPVWLLFRPNPVGNRTQPDFETLITGEYLPNSYYHYDKLTTADLNALMCRVAI
jgi:hypothetical protein